MCCLLDGLRLAGVESDSVKKCVLSICHILGTSTCIHSIISPKTLPSPVKSGDCNIRQPGRGLRVYSLAQLLFHLSDGYSECPPATCQASPVPAAWSYIYCGHIYTVGLAK